MKLLILIGLMFCFYFSVLFSANAGDVTTIQQASATKQVSLEKSKADKRKEDIRTLQSKLIEEGYYTGPVNGIVTPETRRALQGMLSDR